MELVILHMGMLRRGLSSLIDFESERKRARGGLAGPANAI